MTFRPLRVIKSDLVKPPPSPTQEGWAMEKNLIRFQSFM
ncbi:hypothetical protein LEP1GSC058_0241 [Leptospira fainei serovar Hurstbridge str. BUT 6]|uniref:Uncharacterized protein n=1 Tax=Leptospira fainei serovar Hurstbridge str. BUT 6 TaxID=1193011 RepID=S3UPT2_9LEPT|nr:hypothetical protein LEP1GSC058_0241 [Leptospira fainei serovar Hurstbridge str. BUT 6]